MAYLGLRKPANKIVVAGNPLVLQQKIETVANCYPGRLVIKGTNDDDVAVCGAAGISVGWLGYEQANPNYMPTTVDTIYVVNDQAPVLCGGNFIIVASLADNNTVVKGDRLVAAASGEVAKAAAAVTKAGSTPVTGSADDAPISGTIPEGGIVVGIAMESVTTSGASADIMVLSLI